MRRFLRVAEVAELLNLTERTTYRLIASNEIRGVKFRGCLRVDAIDLEAYINSQKELFYFDNG